MSSPFEHWQILAHPQLLVANKIITDFLDKHKFERQPRAGKFEWQGSLHNEGYSFKTWKSGCFICSLETNTESQAKMKKQKNMFQMQEKDKTSGKKT